VLTSREAVEVNVSGPAQFPHTDFGGVIGAAHPALDILEVIPNRHPRLLRRFLRRNCKPGPVAAAFGLAGLLSGGHGQDLVLLILREILERLSKAVDGLRLKGSKRCEELFLILLGIDRQ